MNNSNNPKIECVQFLRFIASFLVMLTHSSNSFFDGTIGVDIFFVISGFIMMYITSIDSKFFLIRRIARIAPLYWMLTILFFLVMLIFPILVDKSNPNIFYLFKSLLFIPYDSGEGHYPLIFLGWTLNYEMAYYIIFGLTVLLTKKYRFYISTFLISIFFLINSLYSEIFYFSYVYSNYIIFEFVFGMIVYNLWVNYYHNIFNKNYIRIILFVVLCTIASYLFFFNNSNRIISSGIPASMIVFYFLFCFKNNKFPFIFVLLGNASYSLYLTHPYIIQLIKKLIHFLSVGIELHSIYIIFFTSFASIIFSLINFFLFEKNIERKIKKYLN